MIEKEQIRSFIFKNFMFNDNSRVLKDNESFLNSGIIDSTGVLELVSFVEETFNIQVNDDELIPENLDSVIQLVQFIQNKKK
ncbi:acyl carrier protein [candidate division KSB1 bacterium]|nr:acyl carrier protein [candidate division KSB1 bacterium]